MYPGRRSPTVPRGPPGARIAGSTSRLAPGLLAATLPLGATNLQETNALLWVILGISIAGALVTYLFLAYALWRFRDPATKGRRYG
jgi:hypothetical protein